MLWSPKTVMGWVTSLGALVGQMLWSSAAAVGWVTSPESWVGTNSLEPWMDEIKTNLMMGFGDVWLWFGIIVWWVEVDGLSKPSMIFYWCVLWDSTFTLGIWDGDEWLKRYLAQSFYGRVECGSPILGLVFSSLMKGYFSLYLYEYSNGLYVVYMAMISLIFFPYYGGYVYVSWH